MKCKKYYIILLFGLIACGSPKPKDDFVVQNGDTLRVVKEYDLRGRLKTERMIDKDSFTQGVAKMFYEDGTLKGEIIFMDDKKNGLEKGYFRNGKIEHTGLNSMGKQDSTWVWYYENGAIRKIDNWMNGKSFGENISYTENGSIKEYTFYTFGGDAIYLRKYDEKGAIIQQDGQPVQVAYNRNHLRVNEKFEMILLLGVMPYWSVDITIEELNGVLIKKLSEKELIQGLSNKKVIVEKYFKNAGSYHWLIDIRIDDRKYNNKIHFKDTVSINIEK